MSFYSHDPAMGSYIRKLIEKFETEFRFDLKNNISITWVCYQDQNPKPLSGKGAGWIEKRLFYPASIVKLFYACAIESWLLKDLILDSSELQRALSEMIINSSNDATSYIVDLLTATTSGPSLKGQKWMVWKKQRNCINDWLKSFPWDEFQNLNCCQKTWSDGPFGRDKDFYGESLQNRNALTTLGTARLIESLMTGDLLPPQATRKLKSLLFRSLDHIKRKENPENQVDGFLGEGLPISSQLWSKAGLMSEVRHDAAWFLTPNGQKMLLIIFSQGEALAKNNFLLPAFAEEFSKWKMQ
ncbi:serine hydrolase [Prochlorococcus marinus]|uniref:serine hydrolase n=1 Tax=Prochlorococcus marinus TaxID=1219 RepID=UPI0022B5A98F|nr:serine hydrolase [Prochlorococcus marinus]